MKDLKQLSTHELIEAYSAAEKLVAELNIRAVKIRVLVDPKFDDTETAKRYADLAAQLKQEIESRG